MEPSIEARFYGRRAARRGVLVKLRARGRALSRVTVELRRGGRVLSRSRALAVRSRSRDVMLRRRGGARFPTGSYTLVIRSNGKLLLRRGVRLGR